MGKDQVRRVNGLVEATVLLVVFFAMIYCLGLLMMALSR